MQFSTQSVPMLIASLTTRLSPECTPMRLLWQRSIIASTNRSPSSTPLHNTEEPFKARKPSGTQICLTANSWRTLSKNSVKTFYDSLRLSTTRPTFAVETCQSLSNGILGNGCRQTGDSSFIRITSNICTLREESIDPDESNRFRKKRLDLN